MLNNFEVIHEAPSAKEYVDLRVLAGLSIKDVTAAQIGLNNSIYTVTIRDQAKLIGMGRIIGDGGCFYQIVDIAVDPSYQGRGLGKQIMKEISEYLEKNVPKSSYVSLIADVPADQLYAKFGFNYTSPKSVGMYKIF